jgi:hypothetical protein
MMNMLKGPLYMQIIKIEGKKIFNTILIIIFSFLSVVCYSDDAIVEDVEKQVHVTEIDEQLIVDSVTIENAKSDEYCVAEEAFNGLLSWFADKIEFIDEKYLSSSDGDKIAEPMSEHDLVKEEALSSKPLDLTIPDVEHEGGMAIDIGNSIEHQFPDLFAGQADESYVKEKPNASFGGRILMDDEELEGMDEYRLKDMRNAVRGAEVSLEFKTN